MSFPLGDNLSEENKTTNKLRIVIGADTYPPDVNGAARFGQRLANGLAERGHDIHVIAPSPTDTWGAVQENGITVHRLRSHPTRLHPTYRFSWPRQTRQEIEGILRDLQPDAVHVQGHFLVGRPVLRVASEQGIRLIATNHFMPENLYPYAPVPHWLKDRLAFLGWWDLGHWYDKADIITTPTPLAAEILKANALSHREVLPISCGIDLSHLPEHLIASTGGEEHSGISGGNESDRQEFTVLFVGRIAEEKRIDELVKAIAKTPENVHAEIVGDGEDLPALKKLARELGIPGRVRFLGHVSDQELEKAYERASLFCMPGVAELQSLVTLEAMAHSKPVVLANARALPHLVEEGSNGYLFEPGDIDGLAEKITQIAALSQEEQAALGRHSRRMVAKHDIQPTLDTFEKLYRGESPA